MQDVASLERTNLIFLHVPKTAGTTLRMILEREFEGQERISIYGRDLAAAVAEYRGLADDARRRVCVFSGHIAFGAHRQLRQDASYIATLREPVARVISLYCHQSSLPRHPNYPRIHAEGLDLAGFVDRLRSPEVNNHQTRLLAGAGDVPFGECDESMLETAKENIRRRFALVVLTERFDESILLLRRRYGWRTPCYVRENLSTRRIAQDEVPGPVLERIAELNRLDGELHAFADGLLQEKIDAQGPGFRKELREFEIINALASRWIFPEVVWPAKAGPPVGAAAASSPRNEG